MPCSRYVNDNMLQLLMINNLLHLQMQILFHGKGGSCVFEGCTTQSYLFTLGFPCRKGEFMNTPTRHYPRTCWVLKGSIMQKIVFTFYPIQVYIQMYTTGIYNNFFSNLSLWASNFLDWLVRIKTSLVQKFWPEDKKNERVLAMW